MKVKIKKVRPDAKIPTYGTAGAGAFDLYAAEEMYITKDSPVGANYAVPVPLGVAVEVPTGHVMLIMPRSSVGLRTPLRMANSIGVIDSDYRGEICALYEVLKKKDYCHISKGERIAQGFIIPVPKVEFEEVNLLSDTVRGTGGFGSTGR